MAFHVIAYTKKICQVMSVTLSAMTNLGWTNR